MSTNPTSQPVASADPFAPIASQLNTASAPQPAPGASGDPFAAIAAQLKTNAASVSDPSKQSFAQNFMDDNGNPAASAGAATRYGFDTVAQSTLDAVKGAASFLKPTPQSDDEQAAFNDVTGEICTRWNERESTWREAGHANPEVQTRANRNDAAAD